MLSVALLLLRFIKRKQVLPLLSAPHPRLIFLALCFSLALLSCAQEEDKDADGAPVSEDCDDNDPSSTVLAEDADCDGVLTAADCDDNDPALLSSWEDPDCDGVVDCLATTTAQEMPFVRMCGGAFDMGCTPGQSSCGGNEFPAHEVSLMHHFWMSRTEVTQAQWQALMPSNPSSFTGCGLDCPVEHINWFEALAFANAVSTAEGVPECYDLSDCNDNPAGEDLECNTITINSPTGAVHECEGYRLPTEAEWEFAARGGADHLYSGSDSAGEVGWSIENSDSQTHPVASKEPNAYGLYDMSGNVWEWVWDWYLWDYYTTEYAITEPQGPDTGTVRGSRGGAWFFEDHFARTSGRYDFEPGIRLHVLGFRLTRTVH
jgi:formylglycine-generating enzyme required for sulfatase activity